MNPDQARRSRPPPRQEISLTAHSNYIYLYSIKCDRSTDGLIFTDVSIKGGFMPFTADAGSAEAPDGDALEPAVPDRRMITDDAGRHRTGRGRPFASGTAGPAPARPAGAPPDRPCAGHRGKPAGELGRGAGVPAPRSAIGMAAVGSGRILCGERIPFAHSGDRRVRADRRTIDLAVQGLWPHSIPRNMAARPSSNSASASTPRASRAVSAMRGNSGRSAMTLVPGPASGPRWSS